MDIFALKFVWNAVFGYTAIWWLKQTLRRLVCKIASKNVRPFSILPTLMTLYDLSSFGNLSYLYLQKPIVAKR